MVYAWAVSQSSVKAQHDHKILNISNMPPLWGKHAYVLINQG